MAITVSLHRTYCNLDTGLAIARHRRLGSHVALAKPRRRQTLFFTKHAGCSATACPIEPQALIVSPLDATPPEIWPLRWSLNTGSEIDGHSMATCGSPSPRQPSMRVMVCGKLDMTMFGFATAVYLFGHQPKPQFRRIAPPLSQKIT